MKPTRIRLYSTSTCSFCKLEKRWLDDNHVDYELVMVDSNRDEAEAMVKKTGQMGVPVTEIRYADRAPQYIVGFDRNRLSQLLGVTNS